MNRKDYALRSMKEDDLSLILQWRNSEKIREVMYSNEEISWEEHYNWFQNMKERSDYKVYIFTFKEKPVGIVNFRHINFDHRRCEWGLYIGEEKTPKGTGIVMGVYAIEKAFHEMKMHKICSHVLVNNTASCRYHEKMGFDIEGRLVDHVRRGESYIDVWQLALFQSKWEDWKHQLTKNWEG
ncbi:UDP-4-amino-4,6-dideoxy-N-acetyl-beta-L-altrosamine N-acetyltransferase [Ornithinibacillus scapharcae]|uniref:UDP-4-amino-4, 6-dideoxy-N-acetyl-beta-L-altrosamine N-acetyltransferase n=1 Tax=Ornithinibacillus scapharcae TaxID=1147159 RepID=UPI000225BFFF|nr:UDP-4-amino-4,6-dideoxy-N-acetyl-beta-L-altrosamine N-acetyltransferase [Ornithinibacillus scapharcae]